MDRSVLFERFTDNFELFLSLRNELKEKYQKATAATDIDALLDDGYDVLDRQRDIVQKVLDEYIRSVIEESG